jgi:hypothetical protein
MAAPLVEEYFVWLYSRVASSKQRSMHKTHWTLLRQLYTKEFVWLVPNDDNRVEDGRDLRLEFFDAHEWPYDQDWIDQPCSMLEMLVALSRRVSFEAGGKASVWFWHLLENVDLAHYTDANPGNPEEIDAVLDRVIWRTYSPSGQGGLFPLVAADKDQRQVELWYQLSAYIVEQL